MAASSAEISTIAPSGHGSRPEGEGAAYSPEIDGLRALAVLSVVFNHFDKHWVPCGHLGVDVFFVISGFVITASLAKRRDRTFREFISGFYVRRIKRLVPALAVCVAVTSVAISLFDPEPRKLLLTGLYALFGGSNIYLLDQATDYFGTSAVLNVFTHTWSLGVEEQYYLAFPFVIWLTGLTRKPGGRAAFGRFVGLGALASLALFGGLSVRRPFAAFYLMPARFWELGAGCLVYVLLARRGDRRLPLSPALLLALLVGVLWVPGRYGSVATVAVVVLTALLIASLRPRTIGHRVLSHPGAVYFGKTSYSLYLWHWVVIALSRWTIGIHPWSIPLQAGLMLALADSSFRYVERPLRSADWGATRGRTIRLGLGTLVLVAAMVLALAWPLRGRLYTGTLRPMAAKGVETLTDPYRLADAPGEWRGKPCVLSDNAEVGKEIPLEGCTLGDPATASGRILVVGNSFSASFVAAFDDLVRRDRWAVTMTSSWGASPAAGLPNTGPWDKANEYYWSTVVPGLEARLRAGDWVFLMAELSEYGPPVRTPETDARIAELGGALRAWSERLATRGVRLAALHGNPYARDAQCEPDVGAHQWFAPFGGPCTFFTRDATLARRAPLDATLGALAREGRVTVVDLVDVFCPGPVCTYDGPDGRTLYRDVYSHASVEAARLSGPVIRRALIGR
jgi:peptidoglycan/LPS O-acetylase OafA/YrhL